MQVHPGDLAIYIEVDSRVPAIPEFEFLAKRNYKIKTQKFKAGQSSFFSQGLVLHPADIGGAAAADHIVIKGKKYVLGDPLTDTLDITYYVAEDNARKSNIDKYVSMKARHRQLFKRKPFNWLMQKEWGRKLLFVFLGKKRDNQKAFPTHLPFVKKTDQERIENLPQYLQDQETKWIETQKCDGSSVTYILERKPFGKYEFYVCSRNVRMLKEEQECYHDKNYYWEMAKKYDIENKMKHFLNRYKDLKYIAWQGELCGPSLQKNPHGLEEYHVFFFHFIDSKDGYWDITKAESIWKNVYDLEVVPVTDTEYTLPDSMEEMKKAAECNYKESVCEGKKNQIAEGKVYYNRANPAQSFKNVSRNYLIKRHE